MSEDFLTDPNIAAEKFSFKKGITNLAMLCADALEDADKSDKNNFSATTKLRKALNQAMHQVQKMRDELRKHRGEITQARSALPADGRSKNRLPS